MSSEDGWWDDNLNERSWWQSLLRAIICSGPVPRHVAFVMDGNRRYARMKHLGSVVKGHERGFNQLAKILNWCRDFNIEEVTIYAFSIENFKRSDEEVDGLMSLAEEKFQKLLDEKEELNEKKICFRFYGNVALLSEKLQKLVRDIEDATRDFKNGRVNVCMPYTSRDEIARAFELVRKAHEKGLIEKEEIDERVIEACLDSGDGTKPDMLVRTSGEKRLSDFMLWQCASSHVYFDDVLWPEFDYYNLCKAILSYQYYRSTITNVNNELEKGSALNSDKNEKFYEWVAEVKRSREI
ncbi:unnamed protein product [Caenorhabditis auriculariae]|uniref:Alkyl transferase n=1 Tax=Caenorhabditis auriculariae TaxID=2777116 RepID=A0A8S1HN66_9PELO|nr:unnamed protein product [Caenorhabditis auriculariae]